MNIDLEHPYMRIGIHVCVVCVLSSILAGGCARQPASATPSSPVLAQSLRSGGPDLLKEVEADFKPEFTFSVGNTSVAARDLSSITGLRPPPNLIEVMERQNKMLAPELRDVPEVALPPTFDWSQRNCVTPVRAQLTCGSCWTFGTVGPSESSFLIQHSGATPPDLSEQIVLDCSNEGDCGGGWWAFNYVQTSGLVTEAEYPYVAAKQQCRNEAWARVRAQNWGYVDAANPDTAVDKLKQAIMTRGPLAAAMNATGAFQVYTGGVFNELPGYRGAVNHAVVITGWDDSRRAWRIKNSWGTGWGESGFAWVAYDANRIGYASAWVRMQ